MNYETKEIAKISYVVCMKLTVGLHLEKRSIVEKSNQLVMTKLNFCETDTTCTMPWSLQRRDKGHERRKDKITSKQNQRTIR